MTNWFKNLFQLSPVKEENDLGCEIPVLEDKDNPFANGEDNLHDKDVRHASIWAHEEDGGHPY